MSLITVAQAKSYLGITDETLLSTLIAGAQARMEHACGRHLASASRTEVLDGDGTRVLYLAEPADADAVTSVHVDSDRAWGDDALISSDDLLVDGCRLEYLDHIWCVGQRNVRVIYPVGFATSPGDLTDAATIQVAALFSQWKRAKAGRDLLESENVAGWIKTYLARAGLEPEVADVVARYRAERL